MDKGLITRGLFLDPKKAFNTVNHNILLAKSQMYGVSPETLVWFENYLNGRQQVTNVNGVHSDTRAVTCGVPQGSILGPLLFIIYVNDINKHIFYRVET